jgi:hypothetical protein
MLIYRFSTLGIVFAVKPICVSKRGVEKEKRRKNI